jgi:hypothetical protein
MTTRRDIFMPHPSEISDVVSNNQSVDASAGAHADGTGGNAPAMVTGAEYEVTGGDSAKDL